MNTDIDRMAAQVTGPEDHVGMAALWRATMGLPEWWFLAVEDDDGQRSPAAAVIDDQAMLLAFTEDQRAREFAVQQGMIGPEDDLAAFALPPVEVVDSAEDYQAAEIDALMFDAHLSAFAIPCDQLPIMWHAVMGEAAEEGPAQPGQAGPVGPTPGG